jgi:predicted membrane-bound dolichyl-phosphate-mannose-protein mannosyltransferase
MSTKTKTKEEKGMLKRFFYPIAVTLLLGVMFVLMFFSAKGDSNIVDEVAHIPSGYSYLTTGDYRLNPEHPPIIKDLAALPLVFMNLKFPYDLFYANNPVINNQWEMGWSFIYKLGNNIL